MVNSIKKDKPVILCITNDVTMDIIANTLLAIGAAPIIGKEESDIEDLVKIADSILINSGTPDKQFLYSAKIAITIGTQKNIPIIFDPVGSGASQYRTTISKKILEHSDIENYEKFLLKGNASEIISLYDIEKISTKGVESIDNPEDAVNTAKKLNKSVCITGKDDFIITKNKITKSSSGTKIMQSVTGIGCALGGVIASYVYKDFSHENIVNAVSLFGICGELAMQKTNGPASFKINFIDTLFNINNELIGKYSKIYEIC